MSKASLLFHTVKYLKPSQVFNQVVIRLKSNEPFRKYYKNGVKFTELNLWIYDVDGCAALIERFKPELLLNNQLTILNQTIPFDKWKFDEASHLWNFNVHYLEYLAAIKAQWMKSCDFRYIQKIESILKSWYEKGSKESDSNLAYTVSLRIVNMLLVEDVVADKGKLYDFIYAQYIFLLQNQEKHILGNHYLENLKAIVICSVIFNEEEIYKDYIEKFLRELDEEITEDGLHFELSLMYHKIVLEDVIRVALVMKQSSRDEYTKLLPFIQKMSTALYSLEYGINRTPLFNDAGDNVAKPTFALLTSVKTIFEIEPELKNSIAGYYKLYDGKITVIADCGKLAPAYMPGHAHCDCLSFELFYDGKPVFVNCGTYQYQCEDRKFFRSTEAHNTVVINGHEQSELWGEHRAARRIRRVKGKTEDHEIIGCYTNYLGENHSRIIRLKNEVFEVIDQTTGRGNVKSFLHLTPGLRYENGNIEGDGLEIRIIPINATISTQQMLYSDCFGIKKNTECLVFSWTNDSEKHGYKIQFSEVVQND